MADYEYEEMFRSTIETLNRKYEFFREQEEFHRRKAEFHRRKAEELTAKAMEADKKVKEIEEARAEFATYVIDFNSPNYLRKLTAEELAHHDKMISTGNEKDLAGANVTTKVALNKQEEEEGAKTCGLVTFAKEEAAE